MSGKIVVQKLLSVCQVETLSLFNVVKLSHWVTSITYTIISNWEQAQYRYTYTIISIYLQIFFFLNILLMNKQLQAFFSGIHWHGWRQEMFFMDSLS